MKKLGYELTKEIKDFKAHSKVYFSVNNAKNITEIRNNLRKHFKFSNKKVNKLLALKKTTVISFLLDNSLYIARCENHTKKHYTDKDRFKIKSLKVFNYVD